VYTGVRQSTVGRPGEIQEPVRGSRQKLGGRQRTACHGDEEGRMLAAVRGQLDGVGRSRPDQTGPRRDRVADDGQATDGRARQDAVRPGPVAVVRGRHEGRDGRAQAGAGHGLWRRAARGKRPVASPTGSVVRGEGRTAGQGGQFRGETAAGLRAGGHAVVPRRRAVRRRRFFYVAVVLER